MKFWRLMATPWQALSAVTRASMAALYSILAIILGHALSFAPLAGSNWVATTFKLTVLNLVVWVLLLPNNLVLARDARLLRVPGVERDAWQSLWLYAGFSIALPGLLLGFACGHVFQVSVALFLGAAIGMAYACINTNLVVVVIFGMLIYSHASRQLDLDGLGDPDFLLWAAPTSVVLWLLVWRSWHVNVRNLVCANNSHAPLVLKVRRNLRKSAGVGANESTEIRLLRQRAFWLRPRPNVQSCGPNHPQRSIRLALGGSFMPNTRIGYLLQFAFLAGAILVMVAMMLAPWFSYDVTLGWRQILEVVDTPYLIWFLGFSAGTLAFAQLLRLWQMWQAPNAGLALLALLPGLGATKPVKRTVLRAIVGPAVGAQAVLLMIVLGCAAGLHLSASSEAMIALSLLGAIGFVVSLTLVIVGGRMLPTWSTMILGVFGCILFNISLLTSSMSNPVTIKLGPTNLLFALVFAWLIFAIALVWVGMRGWHGLQLRPHVFLPTVSP